MRKTLFALLVLALGAGTASAQTAWADKIFGGKTGDRRPRCPARLHLPHEEYL